ncbi:MAG: hypothetical protein FJX46_00035 [Alphaproteobacteria bacterium]|nr:hypothetical protein [Alphaproteobacteria bacterium]
MTPSIVAAIATANRIELPTQATEAIASALGATAARFAPGAESHPFEREPSDFDAALAEGAKR